MAKHNKKRNVGLLHEQLVRYASENLVTGDKENAELAVGLLKAHFRDNSALQKEFKLFNALIHTKVPTKEIAQQIITESRIACQNHEKNELRSEKSRLIKDINHKIDENDFYSRKIPTYRLFATVQALLNEWRGAQKLGPAEVVKYENILEEWLTRDYSELELKNTSHANPLALKIMIEKFNKKYNSLLNEEQRSMMENCLSGNEDELAKQVSIIKEQATAALEKFYQECDNEVLLEKRTLLEAKITTLETAITGETVSKAMTISALVKELEEDDE
jgi:hypothetical protein